MLMTFKFCRCETSLDDLVQYLINHGSWVFFIMVNKSFVYLFVCLFLMQFMSVSPSPFEVDLQEDPVSFNLTFSSEWSNSFISNSACIMLQPPGQICAPSLDFSSLSAFLVFENRKLDTIFQVQPLDCHGEGITTSPSLLANALSNAAQHTVSFGCHTGSLLAHIQLIHHDPFVPSWKTAF